MKANESTAQKIAELSLKAREERAAVQEEIRLFKNRRHHAGIQQLAFGALKAAHAAGLDNPRVLAPVMKSVFLPAALAAIRFVGKKGKTPKIAASLLAATGAFLIAKEIRNKKLTDAEVIEAS